MAYAYSRIVYGADVQKLEQYAPGQVGTITKLHQVLPGEKVTQTQIGVDDDTWQAYFDEGVVGNDPLPDDLEEDESLARYKIRKAIQVMEEATKVAEPKPARKKAKE